MSECPIHISTTLILDGPLTVILMMATEFQFTVLWYTLKSKVEYIYTHIHTWACTERKTHISTYANSNQNLIVVE